MSDVDVIIAVSGWEDRFLDGLRFDIETYHPRSLVLLTFEEFGEMTTNNRTALARHVEETNVELREVKLRREPKRIWFAVQELFNLELSLAESVMLDISTMPREVIWWTLGCLRQASCKSSFIYHRPQMYSSEWLTRDTGEPRLVYQFSGIAKLGCPTCLLLLSGFDGDRAARIAQYFEPALILIGAQTGAQFENRQKNFDPARKLSERTHTVKMFELDAFSQDCGYATISTSIRPYLDKYNVIAASLGPKTSAIALFQLNCAYPEIALAYAPSRQFNSEYSRGIGPPIFGELPIHTIAEDSIAARCGAFGQASPDS